MWPMVASGAALRHAAAGGGKPLGDDEHRVLRCHHDASRSVRDLRRDCGRPHGRYHRQQRVHLRGAEQPIRTMRRQVGERRLVESRRLHHAMLGQVRRCERLVQAQLVDRDVILVRAQEGRGCQSGLSQLVTASELKQGRADRLAKQHALALATAQCFVCCNGCCERSTALLPTQHWAVRKPTAC